MAAMNGIDVSGWQPASIGDTVEYDFVIAKATEGTGFVNKNCDPVVQSAARRQKCWGTYHFATVGDARQQAGHYLSNISGYIGKGIMVLDYEAEAQKQGYAWAYEFCKAVIDATGIPPLVYASLGPMRSHGLDGLAKELDVGLWVAAYPNSARQGYSQPASPLRGAAIYQYASTGRLAGYAGNLDLNVFYGDKTAWMAYVTGGKAQQPAQAKPYHQVGLWNVKQDGTDNQLWKLVRQPGGLFAIQNKRSGLYLDVPASMPGGQAITYPWNGGQNQLWAVSPKGGAADRYLEISSALPGGYLLGTKGGAAVSGTEAITTSPDSKAGQGWAAVPAEGGYYRIYVSGGAGTVLDEW